jgi:hypothetical protein
MINEELMVNYVEGSSRNLIQDALVWTDWDKAQKSSLKTDGLQAKIWTRDVPNNKHSIATFCPNREEKRVSAESVCPASLSKERGVHFRAPRWSI